MFGGYILGPGFGQTGLHVGYNVVRGRYLAGMEVQIGFIYVGPPALAGLAALDDYSARFGFILKPDVLLYSEAGWGFRFGDGAWTLGVGVEKALSGNRSLFLEVKRAWAFDLSPAGVSVQAGMNWRRAEGAGPVNFGGQGQSASGFDWSGYYAGMFPAFTYPSAIQGGLQTGYNFVRGSFLVGIEAQYSLTYVGVGAPGDLIWGLASEDDFNLRMGAILGSRVLLYTEAGVGFRVGSYRWTAGGGVEVAVGSNFSIFAEVKAVGLFGSGFVGPMIQSGVNWYRGGCGPDNQMPRPCWMWSLMMPGPR